MTTLENLEISRADVQPWLEIWLAEARALLLRQWVSFQDSFAASSEVERLVKQGRFGEAARVRGGHFDPDYHVFRRDLERQQQHLTSIEEVIKIEGASGDPTAIIPKLVMIAVVNKLSGANGVGSWCYQKASLLGFAASFVERHITLSLAVAAYRVALETSPQNIHPHQLAKTQQALGDALMALGNHCENTATLQKAVEAHRAALDPGAYTLEPLVQAERQRNLGNALYSLSKFEAGIQRLSEAVALYRTALSVQTYDGAPAAWARTQSDLGDALALMIERGADPALVEEAVLAYLSALEWRTRDRTPVLWSATRSKLVRLVRFML